MTVNMTGNDFFHDTWICIKIYMTSCTCTYISVTSRGWSKYTFQDIFSPITFLGQSQRVKSKGIHFEWNIYKYIYCSIFERNIRSLAPTVTLSIMSRLRIILKSKFNTHKISHTWNNIKFPVNTHENNNLTSLQRFIGCTKSHNYTFEHLTSKFMRILWTWPLILTGIDVSRVLLLYTWDCGESKSY